MAIEELEGPEHPLKLLRSVNNITDQVDTRLVNKPFTECKKTEILIVNRGCVNRKQYMLGVLQRSWSDGDGSNPTAGSLSSMVCAINELQTSSGCEPLPRDDQTQRPPVLPNYLYGNQVYKNKLSIPDTDKAVPFNPAGNSNGLRHNSGSANQFGAGDVVQVVESTGNIEAENSIEHVIGHNRPRKYSFLPGRLLTTYRKCRPYEVLGIKNRCIRKKGKVGFYKHKTHVYGGQNRHRHGAIYDKNNVIHIVPQEYQK